MAEPSEGLLTGYPLSNPSDPPEEAAPLVYSQVSLLVNTTTSSSSVLSESHRRVSEWLGRLSPVQGGPGDVLEDFSRLSYQHSGSNGSFSSPKEIETEKEHSYSVSSGQSDHSSLPQQRRLQDLPYQLCTNSNLPTGEEKVLTPIGSPSGRGTKRHRRHSVPFKTTGATRMVPESPVIPVDQDNVYQVSRWTCLRQSTTSRSDIMWLQTWTLRCWPQTLYHWTGINGTRFICSPQSTVY